MPTATAKGGSVPFTLPPLPYPSEALEPHIDKMTMEIDHDKHHGTYVNNLNKALESAPQLAGKSLEELLANNCAIGPENIRSAVRNTGGGHQQHFRRICRIQRKPRCCCHGTIWLRLGMAAARQLRETRNHFHSQP